MKSKVAKWCKLNSSIPNKFTVDCEQISFQFCTSYIKNCLSNLGKEQMRSLALNCYYKWFILPTVTFASLQLFNSTNFGLWSTRWRNRNNFSCYLCESNSGVAVVTSSTSSAISSLLIKFSAEASHFHAKIMREDVSPEIKQIYNSIACAIKKFRSRVHSKYYGGPSPGEFSKRIKNDARVCVYPWKSMKNPIRMWINTKL